MTCCIWLLSFLDQSIGSLYYFEVYLIPGQHMGFFVRFETMCCAISQSGRREISRREVLE